MNFVDGMEKKNIVQAHRARHTNLLSTSSFARPFSWHDWSASKYVCLQVWFSISRFVEINKKKTAKINGFEENRPAFSFGFYLFGLCSSKYVTFCAKRTAMDLIFLSISIILTILYNEMFKYLQCLQCIAMHFMWYYFIMTFSLSR